jgi:hypothetical protein
MEMESYYHAIRDTLHTLKEFLDKNDNAISNTIKPGLQSLYGTIPQTRHFVANVIFLLEDFRSRLQHTDVGAIPNVAELAHFATLVDSVLEKSGALLPDQLDTVQDAHGTARMIRDLPALTELKDEIIQLTDGIVAHCRDLT